MEDEVKEGQASIEKQLGGPTMTRVRRVPGAPKANGVVVHIPVLQASDGAPFLQLGSLLDHEETLKTTRGRA